MWISRVEAVSAKPWQCHSPLVISPLLVISHDNWIVNHYELIHNAIIELLLLYVKLLLLLLVGSLVGWLVGLLVRCSMNLRARFILRH